MDETTNWLLRRFLKTSQWDQNQGMEKREVLMHKENNRITRRIQQKESINVIKLNVSMNRRWNKPDLQWLPRYKEYPKLNRTMRVTKSNKRLFKRWISSGCNKYHMFVSFPGIHNVVIGKTV